MRFFRRIAHVTVTLSAAIMLIAASPAQQEREIETIAGTGARGLEDGCILYSRFSMPRGLLVNEDGTLTIFDTYNNAIRITSEEGTQVLVEREEYFDSFGLPQGFLIDGDLHNARLNRPTGGVHNADGYLFIADSANHVIRVIRDNRIYTFAGRQQPGHTNGAHDVAQFNTPSAIAIDDNGNLFVADTLNNTIRRITPSGRVSTVAGVAGIAGYRNGTARQALFNAPSGIAVSADGTVIYVADTGNHTIRKIEGGNVTTFAGTIYGFDDNNEPIGGFQNGSAAYAMFNLPRGITIFDDYLIVADSGNHMIRAISTAGLVFTIAGNGEPGDFDGSATGSVLNSPSDISILGNTLYIADTGNNKIKSIALDID